MARDKPKKRPLTDEPESLSHNPFAALRGSVRPAENPAEDTGVEVASEPAIPEPAASRPAASGSAPERLVVRKERTGRGGKTVTRVSGWNLQSQDLNAHARELKRALGCGASVEGDDVCVQGDQVERVAAYLERSQGARVIRGN